MSLFVSKQLKNWGQCITPMITLVAALLLSNTLHAADQYPSLNFKGGKIHITSADGQDVMFIGDYKAPWSPSTSFKVKELTPVEGERNVWQISYETQYPKETPYNDLTLTGRIKINTPKHITVTYDLVSGDTDFAKLNKWLSGAMAEMHVNKDATERVSEHMANWVRDPNGGIAYEVAEGTLYYQDTDKMRIGLVCQGSNPEWKDGWSTHLPAQKVDDHHYQAKFDLILTDLDIPTNIFNAMLNDRALCVKIARDQAYNMYKVGDQITQKVIACNPTNAPQSFDAEISVRDYDGNIVYDYSQRMNMEPYGKKVIEFKLPATKRDLYFVEACIHENHYEAFDRTNIAVLPDYEFKQDSKTSMFGIAAAWPMPSQDDMLALLKRMGVRHTRGIILPKPEDYPDWLHPSLHFNFHPAKVNPTDEEKQAIEKRIREMVDKAEAFNCEQIEFCNEWNMRNGIGKAYLAPSYVENYLKVIHNVLKERNSKVKLTMLGLAGMDSGFLRKMYELGAWEMFDNVNLHPGRGNFTVDYDPNDPGVVGQHGNYWNFYGALKTMKRLNKEFGEKPLILSEVYAPTFPNNFWEDSLRNAGENVVLTCALSQAEGVHRIYWYQLQDSVWWKRGGVRHTDREFHFGLLNRDLSFKPSMMGFINIAEAMDQATFVKHLTFASDDKTKGLLYDKPSGNLAILWNRADGYTLTENKKPYPSPEPWENKWKTRTPMTFDTTGDTVTTRDAMGRIKTIKAVNKKVELILEGAPLIVEGVKFD
jgi:hypothetical protein